MVRDIEVRKVTKDVLMFLCFKYDIISEQLSPDLRFIPEITSEMMTNLCNAVWIQSLLNDCLWEGFFEKHFQRMTLTLDMFINYVSFACYTLNENVDNAYLSFFDTLSLVSYFVFRCWDRGFKQLLNIYVEFFCAFFEKELRLKFEEEGGWKNFNEFLKEQIKERNFAHLIKANIRSFEQFQKMKDSHVEGFKRSSSLYIAALEKFTQADVETHQVAVNFTNSVENEMNELCNQTYDEKIKRFAATDCQLEELYKQKVREGSSEKTKVEQTSRKIQETESENITVKKELGPTGTASQKPNNNDQKFNEKNKEPRYLDPTLPISEKAKILMGDVAVDFTKLAKIVHSLCEKHGVLASGDGTVQKA